jgi:hypothetical protein
VTIVAIKSADDHAATNRELEALGVCIEVAIIRLRLPSSEYPIVVLPVVVQWP